MTLAACAAAALMGSAAFALAQNPDQTSRAQQPLPAPMTFEGCLYEDSERPGAIAPEPEAGRITRYVLAGVQQHDSAPHARAEAARPRGQSAAGDTRREKGAVGTSGRERTSSDPDDAVRVLFTNDKEARTLIGRRVVITGTMSDAETPPGPGAAADGRSSGGRREGTTPAGVDAGGRDGNPDAPPLPGAERPSGATQLPELHATSLKAVAGACAPVSSRGR